MNLILSEQNEDKKQHKKSTMTMTKTLKRLMFENYGNLFLGPRTKLSLRSKIYVKKTYDLVSVVTIWVIVVKIFIHIFLTAIFFSAKLPGHSATL